jgi:hypothetical protein
MIYPNRVESLEIYLSLMMEGNYSWGIYQVDIQKDLELHLHLHHYLILLP